MGWDTTGVVGLTIPIFFRTHINAVLYRNDNTVAQAFNSRRTVKALAHDLCAYLKTQQ
jgi:hypothetical protein